MAMNVPSPSRKAPVTAPFATQIRTKLGRSLHFGENINDEQLIWSKYLFNLVKIYS
jgi:hypothetical protein